MMPRLAPLLTPLALSAVLLSAGRARAAEAPISIGVMPPRLTPSVEGVRRAVEEQLSLGFVRAGADVTTPARVTAALAGKTALVGCASGPCVAELGAALGLPFVAFTVVETESRWFTVRITIVDTKTGDELAAQSTLCQATEPCPPLPETAREVAQETGRKAIASRRLERELAAARARSEAARSAAVSEPSPAVAVAPPVVNQSARDAEAPPAAFPWKRTLGLATIAAGALGVGVGATYLSHDGDQTCGDRVCPELYDTATEGWVGIGLGATALAAGTALLLIPWPWSADTSVALDPSGLSVKGAF
jgi:hypothetical protein